MAQQIREAKWRAEARPSQSSSVVSPTVVCSDGFGSSPSTYDLSFLRHLQPQKKSRARISVTEVFDCSPRPHPTSFVLWFESHSPISSLLSLQLDPRSPFWNFPSSGQWLTFLPLLWQHFWRVPGPEASSLLPQVPAVPCQWVKASVQYPLQTKSSSSKLTCSVYAQDDTR